MATKKSISELVHQYEQQATVSHQLNIPADKYDSLPKENLAALKLLLNQGYKIQLTIN